MFTILFNVIKYNSDSITETPKLSDLVDEDSWFSIKHLELKMSFLSLDVTKWEDETSFKRSKIIVERLNFTNDSAERAVKLTSDFIDAARTEENFQNVLQVVEDHRFNHPNIRKINSSSQI